MTPTANSASTMRLQRRATVRYTGSPVRIPIHSANSTITGNAIPKHTSGMWTAKESACIWRAWSRYCWCTGDRAAARTFMAPAKVPITPLCDQDELSTDSFGRRLEESTAMDLGLTDRACIVTGGSRGIGLQVARQLVAEGARVLLVGRGEDALKEAAENCEGDARTVSWLALDVTEPDAAERAVAACRERFETVDVLVNGAGMSQVRSIEALTDEEWQAMWEIHVMAPMRLMRAAIPEMAERGWGRIVNVSSSSGKRPGQRNVAYSVTKAAELSLSRAYADAYAQFGVLINAVTPGPVASELWLEPGGLVDQTVAARGGTRKEVLDAAAGGLPIRRLAGPEEIASVIVFLCSEQASDVAGVAWSVDGGAVPVII